MSEISLHADDHQGPSPPPRNQRNQRKSAKSTQRNQRNPRNQRNETNEIRENQRNQRNETNETNEIREISPVMRQSALLAYNETVCFILCFIQFKQLSNESLGFLHPPPDLVHVGAAGAPPPKVSRPRHPSCQRRAHSKHHSNG